MLRTAFAAAVAALVLAPSVEAKRAIRIFSPVEKLVRSDVVAVGKVTAIEKDDVLAPQFPGAPDKVAYKVAVVKIESGLVGTNAITHVKIGFVPPAGDPNAPQPGGGRPGRGGYAPVNLTKDMEALFYLKKHHSADFYTVEPIMAPIETKDEGYKAQMELVKKGAAVIADPLKALKAEKADDRTFAAALLVTKYRSYPDNAPEVENVKIGADESKLILKAISEGDWKKDQDGTAPHPYQAFSMLGLNETSGFKFPMVKPGEDFIEKAKEAYTAWLAGAGKDYQITKIVAKPKK
jgi:hypothetical protein